MADVAAEAGEVAVGCSQITPPQSGQVSGVASPGIFEGLRCSPIGLGCRVSVTYIALPRSCRDSRSNSGAMASAGTT